MKIQNDAGRVPCTQGHGSINSGRLKLALCLLMLLYFPVQWIIGRSPGSTSIFTTQHQELNEQFSSMKAALSQQIISQCKQSAAVHNIFFADSDVVSPYLINDLNALPNCKLYRETDITPIPLSRELTCSSLIVDESLPDAWNRVHHWQDLGALEGKLTTESMWESKSGLFGFKLLRNIECGHSGELNQGAQK